MPVALELLRNVQLFHLFDDDELRELAAQVDERTFVAGQTIFKAGEVGTEMHIVLVGKAETFVIDRDGRRVVIADSEPGEIFGELSLLDGEPRSAGVIATVPLRTCVVNREDLLYLFGKRPAAALDILKVLGRRIRKTDEMLRERRLRNPNVVIQEQSSLAERMADRVAGFVGSWRYINASILVIVLWIAANVFLMTQPFDPFPYIALNLVLSVVTAMQAPLIMMSQNRQDAKDRVRSELEYQVNVRAELGVVELNQKLDRMREDLIELLVKERRA